MPLYLMFFIHDDDGDETGVHGAGHPAHGARRTIESAGGTVIGCHRGRGEYGQFLLYSMPEESGLHPSSAMGGDGPSSATLRVHRLQGRAEGPDRGEDPDARAA